MSGRWADTTPADASRWLDGVDVVWWIAGGWAIDLWLDRQTRAHSDLEIGCFQSDLPAVLNAFTGWDIAVARQKQLTPLTVDPVGLEPPFSLWLRGNDGPLWDLEVLAEQRSGDRWLYRRDVRISLPASKLTLTSPAGVRVIRPEVQLLFKSKDRRPKDNDDFKTALPAMSPESRKWLARALRLIDPAHDWLGDLDAAALPRDSRSDKGPGHRDAGPFTPPS